MGTGGAWSLTERVSVVSMSVWSGVVVVSASHYRTRWTRVSCRMGKTQLAGWVGGEAGVGCACGVLKERGVFRHNWKQHHAYTSEQSSYVSEVACSEQQE